MSRALDRVKGFLFDNGQQKEEMEMVEQVVEFAKPQESIRPVPVVENPAEGANRQGNKNPHIGYHTPVEYDEIEYICSVFRHGTPVVINFQRVKDEKTKQNMVHYLMGFCDACDIVLEEWEQDWISVHPKYKSVSSGE